MNTPTKITFSRIIAIVIMIIGLFVLYIIGLVNPEFVIPNIPNTGINWLYFGLFLFFLIASFTDYLDGHLARKNNQVTDFGKFADPLADKLLVCSALICLLSLNKINVYIVLIIIARDFIISGFRLVASGKGVVIAADWSGKVKTALQMVMILFIIADIKIFAIVTLVLEIAVVILTIVSLIDCIVKNRKVLSEKRDA